MKFKQRAFRMRAINQETLEKIVARLNHGYNEELLKDIVSLMSKWKIEFNKVVRVNETLHYSIYHNYDSSNVLGN
jgi:hypothetical protein